MLGVIISFGLMVTMLVALRLYVRFKLLHSVGKDDVLLVAALAVAWVYGSLVLWGCTAGLGRHVYDIAKEGIDQSNYSYVRESGISRSGKMMQTKLEMLINKV